MTPIAPHLTTFLRERLPLQRGASVHTCDSYAYAFQLLLQFASTRFGVTPSALALERDCRKTSPAQGCGWLRLCWTRDAWE